MLGQDFSLRLGISDVGMRVLYQVYRPFVGRTDFDRCALESASRPYREVHGLPFIPFRNPGFDTVEAGGKKDSSAFLVSVIKPVCRT